MCPMLYLETPQVENLLDVPTELLQEILLQCSTPTFLQFCLTCRTVYEIASSCREVLLSHLHRVPGLKTSLDTLPTKELFPLLKKRTAEHLYGANFHSDMTNYIFKKGIINNRASALRGGYAPYAPNVALVEKGGSRVLLYSIEGDEATLHEVLEAPYDIHGRVEVIKAVFGKDGSIGVVQRYEPAELPEKEEPVHPFVRDAMKPFQTAGIHLVIYHCPLGPDQRRRVTFGAFPDLDQYYPTAIGLDDVCKLVVAWQHEHLPDARKVIMHTTEPDDTFDDYGRSHVIYKDTVLLDQTCLATGVSAGRNISPIVSLDLNDNATQALFYNPASAIYNRFTRLPSLENPEDYPGRFLTNHCNVAFDHRNLSFSVAIPFFSTHKTIHAQQRCHWKYLALGIATHSVHGWTVACLLRSQARCRLLRCDHRPNLDRGRRFDQWTVMARLWGYQKSNDSLSGVMATSPDGKRIAIANWNVIYVWALNPVVIIEGSEGEEWAYYPDEMKTKHNYVELKPVALRPEAVVFSMGFTLKEDELVALTDKGVMRWALGPANKGFKVKKMLDMGERSSMDGHETGKLEDMEY